MHQHSNNHKHLYHDQDRKNTSKNKETDSSLSNEEKSKNNHKKKNGLLSPTQHEKDNKTSSCSNDADPIILDPTKYFENRSITMDQLKTTNEFHPYPHKFHVNTSLKKFIDEYQYLNDGVHLEDVEIHVTGRLMRLSPSSNKLRFYDLHEDEYKIQIISNFMYHNEDLSDFLKIHNILRKGDIVGVYGFPGKSKRGELSVFSRKVTLLSPCLHMLPQLDALKEQEIRFRQRYLDLITNSGARKTFSIRSAIIKYIRNFLDEREFIEVETPMMNQIPGGAMAKPFITHHNDLNMDLYMRIAPELYLKMLIVGGFNKVYEVGKVFRNEGIDMTHNPEFTVCEWYWAYADYNDNMNLIEELLSGLVYKLFGKYEIDYHPYNSNEAITLDFKPPFLRLSMIEEIEKQIGIKLPYPYDSDECIHVMKGIIRQHKLEFPNPQTPAKLLDRLCSHFVESEVKGKPTFIIDHPQVMSPMAKWHRSKEGLTERFELFILGNELCNAYTELNDPVVQRQCFVDQAKAIVAGDDEACRIDENFCKSLEYGLPPTSGMGIGIDRLTMFLADKFTIKDVILFPAMRPASTTKPAPQTTSNSSVNVEDLV